MALLTASAQELAAKNEDGVSVLYFLKTVHPSEWANFLERVGVREEAKLFQAHPSTQPARCSCRALGLLR